MGTTVQAFVGGVRFAEGVIVEAGAESGYRLIVPGDMADSPLVEGGAEGAEIEFRVGGAAVVERGSFSMGSHVQLDLTAAVGPDLGIAITDGVASVYPEGTLDYTITVANLSETRAEGVRVTAPVPASTDLVSAAGATVAAGVVSWPLFALEPGTSNELSFSVVVRSVLPQGTSEIVAEAEVAHDGSAGLDVERENDFAQDVDQLSVPPDFAMAATDFTLSPPTPAAGSTVTLSATVRNPGFVEGAAVVAFFDGRLERGARIHERTVTIPAGGSVLVSTNAPVTAETILFSVYADPENEVNEVDEWNNEAERFVVSAPDLAIGWDNLVLPVNDPAAGSTVPLRVVVRNAGRATASNFVVELYDGEPEFGGVLIGQETIVSLAAGANRAIDLNWPSVEGLHYLTAVADRDDRIVEQRETNNGIEKPLFVLPALAPDLTVASADVTAFAQSAATLVADGDVAARVRNAGTQALASAFDVRLFEDRDGDRTFGEGDVELARAAVPGGLAIGAEAVVALPVHAALEFYRPALVVEVDPDDAHLELSEDNNRRTLYAECEEITSRALFPITESWWLKGFEVESTPVVVQLTDDDGDGTIDGRDQPEIVFHTEDALGRAITARRGLDGSELWTLRSTPSHPIAGRLAHLSAADLDGDGVAEIVGVGSGKLFAIDAAGRILWTSAPVEGAYASGWVGSTAIGDLDGDGKPEIAVGRTVLSNTGAVLAVGTANAAQSYNYYGPLGVPFPAGLASHHSVIADVDLDGRAELLAGDTLYRWNGSQLQIVWNANVPDHLMEDGFSAPANLDGDAQAEIVYVAAGKIEVLNHTGSIFASYRWINQPNPFIQPTAWGGPPTIADLDGDGKPEILVAGSTELVAFRANLATYWRKSIDELHGMTAASVFDFEGDGLPEVIYRDQSKLWILDGRSGAVRYALTSTSKTGSEYPLIADIDADGRADLLLPSNKSFAGDASTQGLHVLTGASWPSARRIWNQHSYHQTNVLDDGTVPSPEKTSWSQTDLYRAADPLPTESRRRANLTIGLPRVGSASNGVPVLVRVGNGGQTWAPAGTIVRLFEGDPSGGEQRGQGVLGAPLAPGAFEDLTILWNGPSAAGVDGTAVVDAGEDVVECDESDNRATFVVAETLAPDLALLAGSLTAPSTLVAGQFASITARVDNLGNAPAAASVTWLFDGAPETGLFESATATPTIAPGTSANVALVWDTLGATGARTLTALVDANGALAETDESNNRATVAVSLASPTLADLSIETLSISPPSATIGQPVTLTAEVANRGVALAQASAVALRVNKAEVSRQPLAAPLAHGERRTFTFVLDTLRYTGTLEIEAFADPAFAIAEVTEANNSKKSSLVLATAGISATLRTDKASYGSNQPVALTHVVTNSGAARDVALRVTIQGAAGAVVGAVTEELRALATGATTWPFAWSTGSTATGTYSAVAELTLDGVLVSRSSAPFTVLPDREVTATLATDRSSYPAASTVLLDAAVQNTGVNDVLTGLKSTTRLLSPSGAVLDSSTATLPSISPGVALDLDRTWNVAKSPAGSYKWTLEVRDVTNVLVAYAETPFVVESSSDTGGGITATLLVEPSPVGAGAPLAVEWTSTNGGNSALSGLDLRLRAIREADDTTVYSTTFDWPLALDESRAGAAGIATAGLAAGDYRIVLEALLPGTTKQLATAPVEVVLGVSITDVSVPEGDDEASTANLTIRLSEPSAADVSVAWATADGSAVSGLDYLDDGGLATIPAGELEATIAVSINGDLLEEAQEAFLVVLSSPSGAVLGDDTAVVELLDEEGCPSASLLANGDAELGSATATDLPGWTATPAGSFGRRHGEPTPLSDGAAFGSRGSGTAASLAQTVDLSAYAGRIDNGLQEFVVEAFTRGRGILPTDSGKMTIDFLNAAGAVIGSAVAGPNTGDAWQPLVVRQAAPAGTRRAVVRLTATESAAAAGLQVAFDRLRFRSLGVATASVSSPSATEGTASSTVTRFELTLSCPAPLATSLTFTTTDGTAAAPGDYTAASDAIQLAEGAIGDAVEIEIVADVLDENDETFFLDFAPNPDLILLTPRATATIADDDGAVSLSVEDVSILEGNAGTTPLELTVSLSGPSGRQVQVGYATSSGSALAGTDFTSANGTLTLAPGETSKTVAVAVKGDVVDETTETFRLVLSSPVNASLLDGEATGTIEDDDSTMVSVGDASVAEGNTGQTVSLVFPVALSVPSAVPVSVSFATADGTAIAGTHYVAKSGTLTIPAGSSAGSIPISVIPNTAVNTDRTLTLMLSNPMGAGFTDPEAIGTIRDDDGVKISISDVTVREVDSGTALMGFPVSLMNHNSGSAITIAYTTVDDTAKAPGDYTSTAGVLSVPAGTSTVTISVPIVGNTAEEDSLERFRVVLSSPSRGLITDAEAIGTIVDNDIWQLFDNADDLARPGCVRLTQDAPAQRGTAWRKVEADLTKHFDKTFRIYFGDDDLGGQGIIFAFQRAGLTASMQGFGISTIRPAVGLEMDTDFFNGSPDEAWYDNIRWIEGRPNTATKAGPILPIDPTFANVEDGAEHAVRVLWNANTATLRALYDGNERIVHQNASLIADLFAGSPRPWYGFGANSGGTSIYQRNEHYFCETAICPGTAATPQISVGPTSVVESDTGTASMEFPLTLNCGTDHVVTVDFTAVDGSAVAPADYIATSGTVTFQPGEASKTVVIPIVGDFLAEPSETLTLALSNAVGGTLRYASAVGTIIPDEGALTLDPVRLAEGDSGAWESIFTFRLNPSSATPATFTWSTANGTAIAGADYGAKSAQTVTFAPGETARRIMIPIVSDVAIEEDESFLLQISPQANVVAPSEFSVTIVDDDRCKGYELVRNGGGEEAPSGLPGWTTTSGEFTAFAGSAVAGGYRIVGEGSPPAAAMRQDVDISAFAQRIDSGAQRFRVQAFLRTGKDVASGSARVRFEFLDAGRTQVLGASDSSSLSSQGSYRRYSDAPTAPPNSRWVRVWVTANHVSSNGTAFVDGTFDEISIRALDAPTLTVPSISVAEGSSGQRNAVLQTQLSCAAATAFTVNYQTVDGTAVAGSDYSAALGQLVFAPNDSQEAINVPILGDTAQEGNESFVVQLLNPSFGGVATPSATVTILDDEVGLSVADISSGEGDSGTSDAVFTVRLASAAEQVVRVGYSTVNVTAEAPGDYFATVGEVSFAPGETTKSVGVPIVGDTRTEPTETFRIVLSEPVNAFIADGEAVATIIDDDGTLSIDDVERVEGNSGSAVVLVPIRLSPAKAGAVTVSYATRDLTATAGVDYVAKSGVVTFAAGETLKTVSISIAGDAQLEASELFFVDLDGSAGAEIVDSEGVVTILDDDDCPSPNLLVNPGAEDALVGGNHLSWQELAGTDWVRRTAAPAPLAGAAYFGAASSASSELAQTIDVTRWREFVDRGAQRFMVEAFVQSGSEVVPDETQVVLDYLAEDGSTLLDRFDSGATSSVGAWLQLADLRVAPEGTRFLKLRLVATRRSGTTTEAFFDQISLRSLGTPILSIDTVAASEANDGVTVTPVTIRTSCPLIDPLTVRLETSPGTATAGADYLADVQDLQMTVGASSTQAGLSVVGDLLYEGDETVALRASAPFGGAVESSRLATIIDNEIVPKVTVGPPLTGSEAGSVNLAGFSWVDTPATESHTGTIAWGDGATTAATISPATGSSGTISGSHVYVESGSFAVDACVRDAANHVGCGSTTATIANLPPIVTFTAALNVSGWHAEGYLNDGIVPKWVVLSGGTSVQEQQNGDPSIFSGTIEALGNPLVATAVVGPDPDDDYFGFVLGFSPGESTSAAADFLLIDWKRNDQQGAVRGLALSRVRGIPLGFELWAHFDDAANGSANRVQPLARALTRGNAPWEFSTTYTFRFDYSASRLRVWVNDTLEFDVAGSFPSGPFGFYNFSQASVTYTAKGSAPIVRQEGQVGSLTEPFADPGTKDTHSGEVDWGDGTVDGWPAPSTNGAGVLNATHAYGDDGQFAISACVVDDEGARGCGPFSAIVTNVLPTVIASSDLTAVQGQSKTFALAAFVDPGFLDLHTATVEWGDGTSGAAAVVETGGQGTVRATHAYFAPGIYQVKVCVHDDGNSAVCGTFRVSVGVAPPRLEVSKVAEAIDIDGDGLIAAGDAVAYEIRVTNAGSSPAHEVVLTDVSPLGTSIVSGSVATDLGSVTAEEPATVAIGQLDAGGVATVRLRLAIADPLPTGVSQIANQAFASCTEQSAVPSDDPTTEEPLDPTVTVLSSQAEFRVTKVAQLELDRDGNGQPSPGDQIGYTIEVANLGASTATEVFLNDPLPDHTAIVAGSVESTLGLTVSESPLVVEFGELSGAGVATVRFRVDLVESLPAGVQRIVNQAFVSSAELPVVPSDDPALGGDADPTETTLVAAPRLVLEKSAELAVDADGDEVPSPGDTLEYVVTLQNLGNTSATEVVLRDPAPESASIEPGSATTSAGAIVAEDPLEIEIGELAGGGSVEVRFRVAIHTPIAAGVREIVNQAVVSSAELSDVESDDPQVGGDADPTVTVVTAAPVLTFEKSAFLFEDVAGDNEASPGDALLYRIIVRNDGNTPATRLALDDVLDAELTLELGTVQTSAGAVESESPLRVTFEELGVGAQVEVTFVVRIASPFPLDRLTVENQATLACLELPVTPSDDPATEAPDDPTATPVFVRPSLAAADAVAPENGGELRFRLALSEPSNRSATVDLTTAGGTATAGVDFGALATSVEIPAGAFEAFVPVPVLDDPLDEDDEQLALLLANPVGATLAAPLATGTILDDDAPPAVSVVDASGAEGSSGTTPLAFAVTLSAPSGRATQVGYSTGDASATAPADYLPTAGLIALAAGETAATVAVPIVGDASDELDETFLVELAAPVNLTVADGSAVGTIVDDDLGRLSIADVAVTEGNAGTSDATFTLSLAEPAAREVSVDFGSTAGSATADVDFQPTSGRATIAVGASATAVAVPIVGDTLFEDDETFRVRISAPIEAELVDAEAVGTIRNDDAAPVASIADAAIVEGDEGTVDLVFPVTLSTPSGLATELRFQTAPETASSGVDYLAFTGHLTIPAGESSSEARVEVVGDRSDERDETFSVTLSSPLRATLADAVAIGTILDDDLAQVSISDVTVVEGNSGSNEARFEIALAEPAAEAVSFDYASEQDTATQDFDYLGETGAVAIPPGGTSTSVAVDVVGDTWFEEDERFLLRLANPTAAELVDAEGIGTIRNDEGCASANLVANGSAEAILANGTVASWTPAAGAWTVRWGNPAAAVERAFFVAPSLGGELSQAVDLRLFDRQLRNGDGALVATGAVRLAAAGGSAAIVVELYDALGALVATDTVGAAASTMAWEFLELEIPAPAGTASALVRLVGSGYFDGVGLRVKGAPTLTVADASIYEPDSGSVAMPFTLTLSCPIEPTLRLTVATSAGTATAGLDYTTTTQSLVIARGQVSATVPVPVLGDNVDEPFETLFLDAQGSLSVPWVVLLDGRGTGTIVGDDFCQRTIGYWKEHPAEWAVSALRIGAPVAAKPTLDAYLSYTGGDLTWRLAQQLTAAKLNLAKGSDPAIVPTVEAADGFLVLYPVGTTVPEPVRSEADRLKTLLDKYNNGCRTH